MRALFIFLGPWPQRKNLLARLLSRNYNQRAGIRAWHAGEDTCVYDEDVVCTVNLGVQVHD